MTAAAMCAALVSLSLLGGGCGRMGDGAERRLSLGFQPGGQPIAVGVELSLAVERPLERGHFCVGHCALDSKLAALHVDSAVSSRPDLVQVLGVDHSDPRAPLVRIRTLAPGDVTLAVKGTSGGRAVADEWVLQARPLARIEVSQTQLPENARVQLLFKPVSADGQEVYAGPIRAQLDGAAQIADDDRVAVVVQTGEPGPATLAVQAASSTHLVPLQVGPDRRAAFSAATTEATE